MWSCNRRSQVFGTPRTFQIPSTSYSNGQGSYSTQLPFRTNSTMLATMSDASGFASGGTSDVLRVGSSVSNSNCNTTDPGALFVFRLWPTFPHDRLQASTSFSIQTVRWPNVGEYGLRCASHGIDHHGPAGRTPSVTIQAPYSRSL